jgi:N-carbamoyl-L-amino-acid hydrolase
MDREMRAGVAEIAGRSSVEVSVKQIMDMAPLPFDGDCVGAVQKASDELGFSSRRIVSGAGHDACNIAKVAPTSMIFIPCIDGISHNEVEDAKPEWIHAGGNVLLRAMLERAGRAGD